MSKLQCKLEKPLGSFDSLPSCEYKFLSALSKGLEAFRPEVLIGDRSRSVKDILSNLIYSVAEDLNLEVTPSVGLTGPEYVTKLHANLRIDFSLRCNCAGEKPHMFALELCLDNRITIGTNVLKASAMENMNPGSDTVFVTLERGLLDSGGWDSTYADTEIYERDISSFYSDFVSGQITLLSVGLIR